MSLPLVSCVMATGGRPAFVEQAIRCFRAQTYRRCELVVVTDDGSGPPAVAAGVDNIRWLSLRAPASLGEKLNHAVRSAHGEVIQKLDDDDYYAPRFVASMAAGLGDPPGRCVAALGSFMVLILRTGELRLSGAGWFAGNTLCFPRSLWVERGFREVSAAVDEAFLADHPVPRRVVAAWDTCMVVRHDLGHTWRELGSRDVTEYFAEMPLCPMPLGRIVDARALAFYRASVADDAPVREGP